jgi:hypothetical protein
MVRRIGNFLYKNQLSVDSYVKLIGQGESVLKKVTFIAILTFGAWAQAATGDCYMTNSCTGNPSQYASPETGFSAQNNANLEILAQVAMALGTPADTSTGFTPLGESLTVNSKPAVVEDDPNDNIEK